MRKPTIFTLVATCFLPMPSLGADWVSDANMGAQGVQGAFAENVQGGLFDLHFDCSADEGSNRDVFMMLRTMPDAPLSPGNETEFPVTMSYTFANGSIATSEIDVKWARDDHGINVWYSTFPMDKVFLQSFAGSVKLELFYGGKDGLIFTYSMGGSAKAAKDFVEYCYSGNYS